MVVADGFTGNVALKLSEGVVEMVEDLLREELQSTFSSQMGYLLSQRAFRRFRKRVDYSRVRRRAAARHRRRGGGWARAIVGEGHSQRGRAGGAAGRRRRMGAHAEGYDGRRTGGPS